jgi:hypothetical protein
MLSWPSLPLIRITEPSALVTVTGVAAWAGAAVSKVVADAAATREALAAIRARRCREEVRGMVINLCGGLVLVTRSWPIASPRSVSAYTPQFTFFTSLNLLAAVYTTRNDHAGGRAA